MKYHPLTEKIWSHTIADAWAYNMGMQGYQLKAALNGLVLEEMERIYHNFTLSVVGHFEPDDPSYKARFYEATKEILNLPEEKSLEDELRFKMAETDCPPSAIYVPSKDDRYSKLAKTALDFARENKDKL